MSIKETIEVIKDTINERVSSPILGAFAVFFFACNWKTVLILFKTQVPIEEAVATIEQTRMTWVYSFALPSLCALVFCAVYPWIKYYLSWYTDTVDARRIQKRQKIELKLIGSKKEIIEAESKLEEIRENRLRKAEQEKFKFERELKRQDAQEERNRAYGDAKNQMLLDRENQIFAAETEKLVENIS